ncbi:hypothetical protein [Roseomonas fluvialis]|uniref:Uncharacterized protein n=1 Tax=Roseomonas fluvialis TaxID=1750527 RepID=A0ABN6P4Q1_9PROT|nr:hypothetical protein [Roseomonas fluvialis]BDG73619.1 hypothetical protein Rmf_35480 [Roseomonas fluvialis]
MAWSIDTRIPVTILPEAAALPGMLAGRPAALLAEGAVPDHAGAPVTESFAPEPRHAVACACCAGRSAAAQALDRLFQARVRGRAAWFDRVLVLASTEAGRAELVQALAQDPLTTARFRAV